MKTNRWLFILSAAVMTPLIAQAHCDTLDGPVIVAAQKALDTTNVNLVLVWVKADAEPEIRAAFEKTLAVRTLNAEARELADRYFFETLVRVHRAGEGAPYTGLKPAGQGVSPVISMADRALEAGQIEPLLEKVTQHIQHGIRERFEQAMAKKSYAADDLAAGREFVEAYVVFLHYVEGIHDAASKGGGHAHEAEAAAPESHDSHAH